MQNIKDRRVRSLVKTFRELDAERIDWARSRGAKGLAEAVEEGDYKQVCLRVDDFARAGHWEGMRSVLLGSVEGWRDIERFSFLTASSYGVLGLYSPHSAATVGGALLHLLVLEAPAPARLAANTIVRFLEKRPDEAAEVALPQFAVWLAGEMFGDGSRIRPADITGPLGDLARRADEPELSSTLKAVCEHHLSNVALTEDDGDEFLNYELTPVEVAAFLKLRRKRGLSEPIVDHPLFQTSLAIPPGPPARYVPVKDELLATLLDVAKRNGRLPANWSPLGFPPIGAGATA